MTSVTTIANGQHSKKLFIIVLAVLTLALASYLYYSMTRHDIDLFTIPNPTQGLHQQKPISPTDIPQITPQ